MTRSIHALTVVFLGTLTTGVLATVAFSASGCLLSRAIRCFSILRDAAGVALSGLKIWSLPAFIAAVLIATVVQVRGSTSWWNVVFVAPASMLASDVFLPFSGDSMDIPVLGAASLVLFVGIQLSCVAGNWFGRYPI
ncbi:hypothetical protein [Bradyrhizobium sp. NP1]|uniref:hypothetical protein n=1 Tax=Bradyrhizobium sp. NP1 TaxID=3049772 RepID=UPI0025A612D9|nr:hypothetical protein [Bradyrhizobium sp. NP1]WJR77591.1 hypothetical protein QOU61_33585 [Bradyrhizobium sp. NP1]